MATSTTISRTRAFRRQRAIRIRRHPRAARFRSRQTLQGPTNTQNVSRALQTFFDTTKRGYFNADYNHNFRGSGWHTLKGGMGYQKTINDVNNSYPGGYVWVFWGGHRHQPERHQQGRAPTDMPRCTTRERSVPRAGDYRSSSRMSGINHRLTMNLGSERRRKSSRRSGPTFSDGDRVRFPGQDRAAPGRGVRRSRGR